MQRFFLSFLFYKLLDITSQDKVNSGTKLISWLRKISVFIYRRASPDLPLVRVINVPEQMCSCGSPVNSVISASMLNASLRKGGRRTFWAQRRITRCSTRGIDIHPRRTHCHLIMSSRLTKFRAIWIRKRPVLISLRRFSLTNFPLVAFNPLTWRNRAAQGLCKAHKNG